MTLFSSAIHSAHKQTLGWLKMILKTAIAILSLLFAAVVLASGAQKLADTKLEWVAGSAWLRSAECARTTGKILVLCYNDHLRPIADEDAGDDPGHALALGIYSAVTGGKSVSADIAIVNAAVNFIGLALLASLLFRLNLPSSAAAVLILGSLVTTQYQWLGPHSAQLGAVSLAMLPALVILTLQERRSDYAWLAAAIFALALASLFRQANGLMGLVAGMIAIPIAILRSPKPTRILIYVLSAAGVLLAYKSPLLILAARDFAYGLQPSLKMETHGVWHNLLIGLGAVPNPFNLSWDDTVGYMRAKAVDPSVEFATKHYYDVVRGVYFDIVAEHPFEVARIYLEKLGHAVTADKVWIMIIATGAPALSLRVLAKGKSLETDAVLIVSSLFICFFLGQAALFHWAMEYRFPILLSFILLLGVSIDCLVYRLNRSPSLADATANKSA